MYAQAGKTYRKDEVEGVTAQWPVDQGTRQQAPALHPTPNDQTVRGARRAGQTGTS